MVYNVDVDISTSFRRINMIERFEKFSFNIFSIYHYLHKIMSDEMKKYGLKGPYAIYLIAMSRNETGITSARLADICGRNKADVSRAISDFERNELIKRDGNSSYNAKIVLTDTGKSVATALGKKAMNAVSLVGGDLTEDDREILYSSLESIAEKMALISEKGIPNI
jgi:DNA-binding MarR family transcriptional regulator